MRRHDAIAAFLSAWRQKGGNSLLEVTLLQSRESVKISSDRFLDPRPIGSVLSDGGFADPCEPPYARVVQDFLRVAAKTEHRRLQSAASRRALVAHTSKIMNTHLPSPGSNSVRIVVVQSAEEMAHAYIVRSIAFVEAEGLRVNHAFDGNDYQCTHIVAYFNDEPIGAARIRWFRDFAKIERTAFRPSARDPRILKEMAQFMFDHVAKKGYDRVLTLAETHYAWLWRRTLGFTDVSKEAVRRPNEDRDYYLLEKRLDIPSDAVTAETPVKS